MKRCFWKWILLLCIAWATAAQGENAAQVKWHPGHYAAVDRKQNTNPRYLKGLYADLDATPALRGVLLRFTWSELEPHKDQYDFSVIEKICIKYLGGPDVLVSDLSLNLRDGVYGYCPKLSGTVPLVPTLAR